MTVMPRSCDRLHRRGGVEPLDEHDRGADAEPEADDDIQPEDVEQRQHPVDHVVVADVALGGEALLQVGQQVCVGQHGGARRPGGAAGEHECCEVSSLDLDDVDRVGGQQIVERDHIVDARDRLGGHGCLDRRRGCLVDLRPVGCTQLVDDHDTGADHCEFRLQFGSRARRIEWHRDRTQADGGEVGHDEVWRIADDDRDTVVDSNTCCGESASECRDLLAQLAIGGDSIPPDESDRIVVVTVDDVREIHGVPLRSPLPRSKRIVLVACCRASPFETRTPQDQRLRSETTPATRMTSSSRPSVNVVAGRMPRGYPCWRRSVTGWVMPSPVDAVRVTWSPTSRPSSSAADR